MVHSQRRWDASPPPVSKEPASSIRQGRNLCHFSSCRGQIGGTTGMAAARQAAQCRHTPVLKGGRKRRRRPGDTHIHTHRERERGRESRKDGMRFEMGRISFPTDMPCLSPDVPTMGIVYHGTLSFHYPMGAMVLNHTSHL